MINISADSIIQSTQMYLQSTYINLTEGIVIQATELIPTDLKSLDELEAQLKRIEISPLKKVFSINCFNTSKRIHNGWAIEFKMRYLDSEEFYVSRVEHRLFQQVKLMLDVGMPEEVSLAPKLTLIKTDDSCFKTPPNLLKKVVHGVKRLVINMTHFNTDKTQIIEQKVA